MLNLSGAAINMSSSAPTQTTERIIMADARREYKPYRDQITRALSADVSERCYYILRWKKLTSGTALYKLIEQAVEQAWGGEYDATEHIHVPKE